MTPEREAKLRDGGLLYRSEDAEVWAALDAEREQSAARLAAVEWLVAKWLNTWRRVAK